MIRIIYLVSFLLISCSGEHSSNEHSQFLLTNSETVNLKSPSKVIVINYWATWCAPCRKEIPELNELDHQLSDRIDVIGVNFDGVVGEQLNQQMAKLGIEFDNLYTDPRHIWGLDAVMVLPETLIINGQGQLMHRLIGPQTKSSLETLINAL
jgi:thiol-disulfide isomerase/thioredoxin